jgi:hypothetical protein
MAKPNTNLENLIPSRMVPRAPVAPVNDPAPPEQAATKKPAARQPSRVKAVMIAGHFDPDVSFAVHELCGKLTRQKGQRVTVQSVLAEALADWFVKNGATPPEGLESSING